MKWKLILPLLTWLIPTIIISLVMFRLDAPLTQTQNYGFAALLISACITYLIGIKTALKKED